jgi:hypothetical protein
MNNFIYFGTTKIADIIEDYTVRVVEAGDNWHAVSSTLIPSSISSISQLSVLRKQMVQSACAVSF